MYILAIETTGPHCSVALINETGHGAARVSQGTLNHLTNLTPMIKEILEYYQVEVGDLKAIAVSQGPGSFTGIRIGVTTARALCQAKNIPAIAVPTLESFAYADKNYKGIIVPMFDARRSQVFAGAYRWNGGYIEQVVKGDAYNLADFLEKLASSINDITDDEMLREVTVYGDGAEAYGERVDEYLDAKDITTVLNGTTQHAKYIAKLGLELYNAGKTLEYGQLHPEYMRKAEAERKLEEARKAALK
ncbi:MAG: tRNA (adenosine(37)-N6)-threonylcarbamoyltransferase complex dimerization subunit type 1 TsaB [Firmicutes bacterium]|nr:tRNA (adenosine(37)-N6)-threonylcarbamoyltransferase complex dimerization subunit type 1 TsaB [Bacillota bacterium]MBQ9972416.1 tRNA (adenosine(37)-N6)-threonylcarbamoyltransferase complex dimerization subunit type 1 TsaB [Bacillota bacterium]